MVDVVVRTPNVTVNKEGVRTVKVKTGPAGPPGPQGERGPKGETGASGTTFRHVHTQETASDTWTVTHDLGGFPSTTVVDSGGTVVEGDVEYLSENTVEISFSSPFAGQAFFS